MDSPDDLRMIHDLSHFRTFTLEVLVSFPNLPIFVLRVVADVMVERHDLVDVSNDAADAERLFASVTHVDRWIVTQ